MPKPLVTISIPTYNSELFLADCLNAIREQTYKNIEINIVDGNSKDKTTQIAKAFGVKTLIYPGALLGARYEGLKVAKGEYILLLDSDQILAPDTIERAVAFIESQHADMLIFEEDVFKQDKFLEKLFHYDRKLINSIKDLSPYTGVMLPRFYKVKILKKAFANILPDILKSVGGQDHAIIYLEAWNQTNRVNILLNAVKHIEPSSINILLKKFYRWGYTSVGARSNKYSKMLSKKERFRKGLFRRGLYTASIASIFLLILKGVPYKIGYYHAKLKSYKYGK